MTDTLNTSRQHQSSRPVVSSGDGLSHGVKRRILIFSMTYFPTRVGGAEVAIREITDRLPSDEYEFDMVTLHIDSKLPKVEKVGNVTLYRVGWTADIRELSGPTPLAIRFAKVLFPFQAAAKAAELHRVRPYDGIWAMMAAYAGFAALFFKKAHPKVPYLLTLQEGDPIPHILGRVRFVRPWFNRIFTKADAVQTISTYLAQWARAMHFAGPLTVVPNGVDTERFSAALTREERARIRSTFGVHEEDTVLITTSRLVHKNGIDDVIRALALLPNTVKLVIFGTGPDEQALRTLATKEGVAARAFFKGQAEHDALPAYLRAADIFIRPSRSEGMGNSFIEAMAAEVPVIATQEGGIKDFLFDAKRNPSREATGWAVDPNAPEQIKDAVNEIQHRSDRVAETVKHARTLVRTTYDWKTVAESMRRVFDTVLNRPSL